MWEKMYKTVCTQSLEVTWSKLILKLYVYSVQKLIHFRLFTELFHEDFSSVGRRNTTLLTSELCA